MVATATVKAWKGGSDGSPGSEPTITTAYLRTDDNPDTSDLTNPLVKPTAGNYYSFWMHLCLDFSDTFTQINNIRHYCDGTIGFPLGTGGEVRRGNRDSGDEGCPKANYDVATGTEGTTGDELGATHAYYSGQTTKTTNLQSDVVGSPATIDSTNITTPGQSKAIVLQAKLATDCTGGAFTAETMTWLYDEI